MNKRHSGNSRVTIPVKERTTLTMISEYQILTLCIFQIKDIITMIRENISSLVYSSFLYGTRRIMYSSRTRVTRESVTDNWSDHTCKKTKN